MKQVPFLNLATVNSDDLDEMVMAAGRVIRSGRYLHGQETEAFERELAMSSGLSDVSAIGVSNGLDALRLIIRGYIELGRLRPGDEVLYPANTYIASILPVSEFGLVPVAVEPDAETHNIRLATLVDKISPRTRALMLVHLYGRPCWDKEIMSYLRSRGILVVEDNAQAIGARAREEGFNHSCITGSLGDAAAFSFYPTKNIGAVGDAGAVLTTDPELAATIRALANYGSDRRYHNLYCGYNCRLDEIQAAMLRVRLRRLPEIIANRRATAEAYSSWIKQPAITLPSEEKGSTHVWHQYVIRHPHRDRLGDYLRDNGISTDIHYAVPPHRQPCYKDIDFGPLPIAEMLADTVLSLPIAGIDTATAKEISMIINEFRE